MTTFSKTIWENGLRHEGRFAMSPEERMEYFNLYGIKFIPYEMTWNTVKDNWFLVDEYEEGTYVPTNDPTKFIHYKFPTWKHMKEGCGW
jgi:hypothetical protein